MSHDLMTRALSHEENEYAASFQGIYVDSLHGKHQAESLLS